MRKIIIAILVTVVGGCCLAPLPVPCGAPGRVYRTAPDIRGVAHIFYELEPLTVLIVEAVLRVDLPIYYTSWDSSD